MAGSRSRLLDVEFYIDKAAWHGELSDPDHEVGDLQQYLRQAWVLLTPEQRIAFARSADVQETLSSHADVTDDLRELEASISQSTDP